MFRWAQMFLPRRRKSRLLVSALYGGYWQFYTVCRAVFFLVNPIGKPIKIIKDKIGGNTQ